MPRGSSGRQLFFNLDPAAVGFDLDEVQARRDDFIQILIGQPRFHVSSVIENLLNQPFNPIDVLEHNSAEFTDKVTVIFPFRSQLDEGLDRGQRVSDFMREACRDGFQRTQSISSPHEGLRLPKILIQRKESIALAALWAIAVSSSLIWEGMTADFDRGSEQDEGDQLSLDSAAGWPDRWEAR